MIQKTPYHVTIACLILLMGLASCHRESPNPPVNLLIIYPDQMRGQAMGFLGLEHVKTPHLDQFASQSLVLNQAVSNYPICSPTRASFMTGQYPQSHGVWSNCNSLSSPFNYELPTDAQCWSDVLKEKGYDTGYIGKWHLDNPRVPYIDVKNNQGRVKWNEWTPPDRRHGFDFWYAYGTYDYHNRPMYWSNEASRDFFHFVDQWGPEHETDLAIAYLKNKENKFRDANKPFALMVSMNPPHMPYNLVPEKYKSLYDQVPLDSLVQFPNIPDEGTKWGDYYRKNIKNYYAMISGVDDQLGRIMATLKLQGLEKNTLVLFASDHGNCLGIHDEISKNNHYEESMRIPFLIRWPEHLQPRIDDLLISTPDFAPTLLGLMGFHEDIPPGTDGTDYSNLFLTGDGERPNSQLFMSVNVGKEALGARGVRTHRYTLMIQKDLDKQDQVELFDNQKDPFQLNNLSEKQTEIRKTLTKELEGWLVKTKDPWL